MHQVINYTLMKKLHKDQILVLRKGIVVSQVSFYQVIRSTSRTCDVRKLRKRIIEQKYNEQKVEPIANDFIEPSIRCPVLNSGCVKIREKSYAWPWKGDPEWQTLMIFIP